jgi:hypothetical protein
MPEEKTGYSRNPEYESVTTEEEHTAGSFHTVPPTGDAADLQTAIDNATAGDTVYFPSVHYNGSITIDKALGFHGAGVHPIIESPDSGPFVVDDLKGAVIDNSAGTGPALTLDGVSGLEMSSFGVKSGGDGIATPEGVASDDPRLFHAHISDIYVHDTPADSWAWNLNNAMNVQMDHIGASRVGRALKVDNQDSTWNYGHFQINRPYFDIGKAIGNNATVSLRASDQELSFIRLLTPHVISEDNTTMDFGAYHVDANADGVIWNGTVENASQFTLDNDSASFRADFHYIDSHAGPVRDANNSVTEVVRSDGLERDVESIATEGGAVVVSPHHKVTETSHAVYDDFSGSDLYARPLASNGIYYGDAEAVYGVNRPIWEVTSGSPSMGSGTLTLPGGSRAVSRSIDTRFTTGEVAITYQQAAAGAQVDYQFWYSGPSDDFLALSSEAGTVKLKKVENGTYGDILSGTVPDDTAEHTIRTTRDESGNWELFADGTSQGTATDTFIPDYDRARFNNYGSTGVDVHEYTVQ